jgi:hypothetical protein
MSNLANLEDLEDEREREEEIKRLREAMKTMTPKDREFYEKFILAYDNVSKNLKGKSL